MKPATLILAAGAGYGAWWAYNKLNPPADGGQGFDPIAAAAGAGSIVAQDLPNIGAIAVQDVGIVAEPLNLGAEAIVTAITGLPRGIRNKNPTNILYNAANQWRGAIGTDIGLNGKVYVVFSDPVWGIRAAMKILQSYAAQGFTTLAVICARWVTGSGQINDGTGGQGSGGIFTSLANYSATVSAVSGLGLNDQLDTNDESSMIDFVTGLIAAENGQTYARYYTYMQMASAWSAL